MNPLVVVTSTVLGAVFVLAGAVKITGSAQWRAQAADFGAPAVVASTLPWVEIVLGALAVAQVARRWTALAMVAMLVAFTVAIAVQLQRGHRPPCACFGTWSARPIGAGHLLRNLVLSVAALLVVIAA